MIWLKNNLLEQLLVIVGNYCLLPAKYNKEKENCIREDVKYTINETTKNLYTS